MPARSVVRLFPVDVVIGDERQGRAVWSSVAVPLLVRSHHDHAAVARWWNGQEITLSGHALAEAYSVLTRLPCDARLAPPTQPA